MESKAQDTVQHSAATGLIFGAGDWRRKNASTMAKETGGRSKRAGREVTQACAPGAGIGRAATLCMFPEDSTLRLGKAQPQYCCHRKERKLVYYRRSAPNPAYHFGFVHACEDPLAMLVENDQLLGQSVFGHVGRCPLAALSPLAPLLAKGLL